MTTQAAKSHGLNQTAERLKSQGNEFHQNGQYKAAYRKYTDAIKEDPKNAVYYANRAAASLALREFMDAAADAEKATKLDPTYAKAWARLGTAKFSLSAWTKSIDAWKNALNCLPATGDQETETDKKLRSQFSEGLQKAEEALKQPLKNMIGRNASDMMPWQQAAAQEQQLIAAQKISSGLVILTAYREFKAGVDTMKALEEKPMNGKTVWVGTPNALVDISNAILRDPRVFHFDCSDWSEKYNRQVIFEVEFHKAWKDGGAKTVMELVPARLRREGWEVVRPALSTTIRAWLMCGFLSKSTGRLLVAMEYYSRVVNILDWGRRIWQNVSKEDRGIIFEKTFVRGVKRLRLAALHECLAAKEKDCQYSKDDMAEWSRDIISETEANPPSHGDEVDPGFFASFWLYPKAEALSILGWYHMQLGLEAENFDDANVEFTQSARYYIQSAEAYPEDDENVPTFLKVALEAYFFQGKALKDTIPLIMRIEAAIPNMLKFWGKSASSSDRDPRLQDALTFGHDAQGGIANGSLSLDDVVKPKILKSKDKWGSKFNVVYI